MGGVEDRIAPELRVISTRLDALDKNVDENEHRSERRPDEIMGAFRQVLNLNSIYQRLNQPERAYGTAGEI